MIPIADLVEPIDVALFGTYGEWDAGFVFWWRLKDAQDRRTAVSIDDRKDSPTCHRLFQGAKHPDSPEAHLVDLGSEEEGIAIPVLSKWFDLPPKDMMGTRHSEEVLEIVRDAILRIGEEP